MNNLAHQATKGTIFAFLGAYAVTAINFIAGIILARILAPEHFGVFALAIFYLTAFSVLKDWGAEFALMHRQDNVRATASTLFFLQVALSFLSVILALASSFFLKKVYDPEITVVLLVLVIFSVVETIGSIPKTLVEKKIEFRSLSVLEVVATIIGATIAITSAISGFGIWSLVIQRISVISVKTIGFWFLSRFQPIMAFDLEIIKWFVKTFGVPIFISSLASLFLFQFDNFLIGTFVGAAILGYYTKAFQFATLPTQLITHVISRVAFPVYAKCQDDRKKLTSAFTIFLKGIWRLSLPIAICLFVLAPDIIKLLIGEKWLPAAPLLRILAGYSLSRILLDDTGALFAGGLGRPRLTTMILGIQAVLLVIVGFILTRWFGEYGMAVAVDLIMLIGVIMAYIQVKRALSVNLADVLIPPLFASALTIIIYWFTLASVNIEILLFDLIIKGVFLVFLYLFLLFLVEGKDLIRQVKEVYGYIKSGLLR